MAISLKSISRNTSIAPPRIVLHGPQGVGKSTFAASAPNPIFLPTEDGLGRLDVQHFPLLRTFQDVLEALGALYQEDHEFQTAVLDTADWMEPLVWAKTCEVNSWGDIETPGYGKGYLAALTHWMEILEGFNALREQKHMAIIVIAHSDIKRFNAPDTEPYDRYQIKLQERASAKLQEWSDCVLFANFVTHTAKTDVGFNKKVIRGVGFGERMLYTEERPAFKAKNRYALPAEMPLSWEAFESALSTPKSAADAA